MKHSSPPRPDYKISEPVDSPVKSFVAFDFSRMPTGEIYRLLIGAVVPRPIAWVSTVDAAGRPNLAPFSFFNAISSNPPCLVFSPTFKQGGREKDTLANIRETGEFVVNTVSEWNVEPMHQSSAEYDKSVNELELLNLTSLPSAKVRPPRIKESPIQFECVLEKLVPVGEPGLGATTLVIGRVVHMHVWDEALADGKVLIEKIAPVARLGGRSYGWIDHLFELWDADDRIEGEPSISPV